MQNTDTDDVMIYEKGSDPDFSSRNPGTQRRMFVAFGRMPQQPNATNLRRFVQVRAPPGLPLEES